MKKELKKIVINFSDINKKCDSEYRKLSDKMHNLELSHNRKSRLLEKIKKQLIVFINWDSDQINEKLQPLINDIEREINAPLRIKDLRNAFKATYLMEKKRK